MKVSYHGHSVVLIETNQGEKIIIDPFLTGNPLTDLIADQVKFDYILVTHGHNDHVGDMVSLAKKNSATLISIPEISHFGMKKGIKKVHEMNIGGSFEFPFGRVKMVFAQHSSGYTTDEEMIYMGEAAGFVIEIDGVTIYHAGDTAYFSDLELLSEDFDIDLAFLPIGDNFTMGIRDAVKAQNKIQAKKVVPMHYDTFPVIEQNPQEFINQLPEDVGYAMKVGEVLEY